MVTSSEQVAPHAKEVLYEPAHRQEPLRVFDRLEPSHVRLEFPILSLQVSRVLTTPACIAGVLVSRPNFNAVQGELQIAQGFSNSPWLTRRGRD